MEDADHPASQEREVEQSRVTGDGNPETRDALGAAGGPLIGIGTLIAAFLALLGNPGPRYVSTGLLVLAAAAVPVFWRIGLSSSRKFQIGISTVLTLILFGTGLYVGFGPLYRSHGETASVTVRKASSVPHFSFIGPPHPKVPWCSAYYLSATGPIPSGYKLVIFVAGTDVGSSYSWENVATPVPGQHNQWVTPVIYLGPEYRPNINSHSRSKPVVYAGYDAIVIAELVSDQISSLLAAVSAPLTSDGGIEWGLKELPGGLEPVTIDVTRNSDISGC